jgi:hypothetical protein
MREQQNRDKRDAGEHNTIEGKFGEDKRKYGLGRIRVRVAQTSLSTITLQLPVNAGYAFFLASICHPVSPAPHPKFRVMHRSANPTYSWK